MIVYEMPSLMLKKIKIHEFLDIDAEEFNEINNEKNIVNKEFHPCNLEQVVDIMYSDMETICL